MTVVTECGYGDLGELHGNLYGMKITVATRGRVRLKAYLPFVRIIK